MATTYKVRYKNHCTPQEQISSGGRFYLDSDCGRKLTGDANVSATLAGTGTKSTATISTSPTGIAQGKDFVYIKNTGNNILLITFDNSNYYTKLNNNESFASEISSSADVRIKAETGTTTVEYFVVT